MCFTGEPNDFVPQTPTEGQVNVPTNNFGNQEILNNLVQENYNLLTSIAKLVCPSLIGSIVGAGVGAMVGGAGAMVAGATVPPIAVGAAVSAGVGGVITLLFKLFGSN